MTEDTTHTHVTERDGLEASWTLIKRGAEIEGIAVTQVYDTADDLPVVPLGEGPYPDLCEARRRWPKLTNLWDAVRHDFWRHR